MSNELLTTVLKILAEEFQTAYEKSKNGERVGGEYYIEYLKRIPDFGPAFQFEFSSYNVESDSTAEPEIVNCWQMLERVAKVVVHNSLERDDFHARIKEHKPE